MQDSRYCARLICTMNLRHRQLTAWLLSIVMMLGHVGSVLGQVTAAPMPEVNSMSAMETSRMAGHAGMTRPHAASESSMGHQMSSSMPDCHTGQCVMCDHCAMVCVGLVSCLASSMPYPLFAFDAPVPRSQHPPLLVFSFLRPPDSSLT